MRVIVIKVTPRTFVWKYYPPTPLYGDGEHRSRIVKGSGGKSEWSDIYKTDSVLEY